MDVALCNYVYVAEHNNNRLWFMTSLNCILFASSVLAHHRASTSNRFKFGQTEDLGTKFVQRIQYDGGFLSLFKFHNFVGHHHCLHSGRDGSFHTIRCIFKYQTLTRIGFIWEAFCRDQKDVWRRLKLLLNYFQI